MSAAKDLADARRRCGQADPFLRIENGDTWWEIDLRRVWMISFDLGDIRLSVEHERTGFVFGAHRLESTGLTVQDVIDRWKAVRA